MKKARLEAFSDGVLAIIITIMVLEIKVPHGEDLQTLLPLWPVFLSYVLSFMYIGIYWNNHHHMLHTVEHIHGNILWGNLHLLFWLSLVPFATGWMGENHFAPIPTMVYGIVLFMAAFAYWILQYQLIAIQGNASLLKQAVDKDWKGKSSLILYSLAMIVAPWLSWLSLFLYIAVAIMWFIPDQRIEKVLYKKPTMAD